MNLSPVICDLLLHNQKVTIPGFGTFIIIQRPAQLNRVTRVLTPPSKVVRFDMNQQNDDGLISGYLINKLKQDKESAVKAVEDFAGNLRSSLTNAGVVAIDGLGTLTRLKSGDIEFSADEELTRRISLFDLPKISIPAPPAAEKVVPVAASVPPVTVSSSGRRWLWWIPASIVLVLLILAGIIYATGNAGQLISDVKGLFGKPETQETERIVFGSRTDADTSAQYDTLKEEISKQLDEQVDRDMALVYREEQVKEPVVEPPLPAVSKEEKPLFNKSFHIIAGAFQVPNNAERLKNSLIQQGLKAEVLPKWGEYYLVSLGSYSTYDAAMAEKESLNERLDKELWVLKR